MISAEHIFLHTVRYLITAIPVFIISIFIMSLLTYGGYITKISWIARPLMRFGHLHESLGVTFITAFGSPSAASAMLRSLYEKGLITRNEVIIAVLSNAFPVMVMETRSMLPVMISFLGETGFVIFMILIVTRFIQTLSALLIGRIIFTKLENSEGRFDLKNEKLTGILLIKKSLTETLALVKRILKITIPVSVLIFTLIEAGLFDYISNKIGFITGIFGVPLEGLSIIAAYMGNYMAAYTVAGNLLSTGALSHKEIIITILTGKVLSSLIFALRHSAPYYIGIFGSGLGTRITIINTMFRNCFDIGVIILLKFLW